MILIVDKRAEVRESFFTTFKREGFSTNLFDAREFDEWTLSLRATDLQTIEGILIGDCDNNDAMVRRVRQKHAVPVIAMLDVWSLDKTLEFYAAGVDDVVRKPIHARELLARFAAIARRHITIAEQNASAGEGLEIFADGRDPKINGVEIELPRRERRILEFLASSKGRRVSREQLFEAVYGMGDECCQDSVVESHISKLRKKLRHHLGYDPINSQRYLGYQLVCNARKSAHAMA